MSEHKDKQHHAEHEQPKEEAPRPPMDSSEFSAVLGAVAIDAYTQFREGKPVVEIFGALSTPLLTLASEYDRMREARASEEKKLDEEAERLHAEALMLEAEARKLDAEAAGALEVNAMRDRDLAQWHFERDDHERRRRAIILSSLQGGADVITALGNATAILHDEDSRREAWEETHPRPTSERLPTPGVRYRSIDPNMRFVPVG